MNYTYLPNNLSSLPVEEIAEALRNSLSEIEIPDHITYESLSQTSQQLSYLVSLRSYLIAEYVKLDLATRSMRKSKGPDYDDVMAKKKVAEVYIAQLDELHATLSRMITIYQLELNEIEML